MSEINPVRPDPSENPGQTFEQLLLLSSRLTREINRSGLMAKHGLDLSSFIVLSQAITESNAMKTAKLSGLTRKELVKTVDAIAAAGLVTRLGDEGDKKALNLQITDKGREALAEMRAEIANTIGETDARNWRAVPRIARIVAVIAKRMPVWTREVSGPAVNVL